MDVVAAKYRLAGVFMQSKWDSFIDLVGDDPMLLWVFGTNMLIFVVYWSYAAFFTFMDMTERPHFLRKYKVQPGQNEPVERSKLIKAIKVVLINLTIVAVPFSYVAYNLAFKYFNSDHIHTLPHLTTFLMDLAVFSVVEEIMFYYLHRALHHKSVYKYVHKKHHEWTAPVAAMTLYAHPVEHIVVNLMPVVLSVGIRGSHILSAWVFFSMAVVNAMNDHAGYAFPFSNNSVRFHDYHHAKFNYNFGVFGWLDKLHGTFRDTSKMLIGGGPKGNAAAKGAPKKPAKKTKAK